MKGRKERAGAPPEAAGGAGGLPPEDALPGDLGRIAEVAGLEAAVRIARAFRGTCIYVPDITRRQRDEEIRSLYDRGKRVREIALRYRLTERTVRNILKKSPKETVK